jgi:hypothetical protein
MPGAHDAISARLIARAGFKAYFIGGFPLVGARYGLPDVGLAAPRGSRFDCACDQRTDFKWNQVKDVFELDELARRVRLPYRADLEGKEKVRGLSIVERTAIVS